MPHISHKQTELASLSQGEKCMKKEQRTVLQLVIISRLSSCKWSPRHNDSSQKYDDKGKYPHCISHFKCPVTV